MHHKPLPAASLMQAATSAQQCFQGCYVMGGSEADAELPTGSSLRLTCSALLLAPSWLHTHPHAHPAPWLRRPCAHSVQVKRLVQGQLLQQLLHVDACRQQGQQQ
jgi:hypothetical protein